MPLSDLLALDAVVPALKVNSKKQVLQEISERASALTGIGEREIFDILLRVRNEGTAVLLVEQNAAMALDLADRAYVLETGLIKLSGTGRALAENVEVQRAYLGVGP